MDFSFSLVIAMKSSEDVIGHIRDQLSEEEHFFLHFHEQSEMGLAPFWKNNF